MKHIVLIFFLSFLHKTAVNAQSNLFILDTVEMKVISLDYKRKYIFLLDSTGLTAFGKSTLERFFGKTKHEYMVHGYNNGSIYKVKTRNNKAILRLNSVFGEKIKLEIKVEQDTFFSLTNLEKEIYLMEDTLDLSLEINEKIKVFSAHRSCFGGYYRNLEIKRTSKELVELKLDRLNPNSVVLSYDEYIKTFGSESSDNYSPFYYSYIKRGLKVYYSNGKDIFAKAWKWF